MKTEGDWRWCRGNAELPLRQVQIVLHKGTQALQGPREEGTRHTTELTHPHVQANSAACRKYRPADLDCCCDLPSSYSLTAAAREHQLFSTSDRVTNEGLSFHHPWQAPGQDTGRAGGSMYPRLKL